MSNRLFLFCSGKLTVFKCYDLVIHSHSVKNVLIYDPIEILFTYTFNH